MYKNGSFLLRRILILKHLIIYPLWKYLMLIYVCVSKVSIFTKEIHWLFQDLSQKKKINISNDIFPIRYVHKGTDFGSTRTNPLPHFVPVGTSLSYVCARTFPVPAGRCPLSPVGSAGVPGRPTAGSCCWVWEKNSLVLMKHLRSFRSIFKIWNFPQTRSNRTGYKVFFYQKYFICSWKKQILGVAIRRSFSYIPIMPSPAK